MGLLSEGVTAMTEAEWLASTDPQEMLESVAGKTTERKLANGTLVHARSRLMNWCVTNVKIEPTATAIRATKQNAGDAKIDPWCALMDASTVMLKNPEVNMPTYQMFVLA
jgi:phage terminase large subunit-like protein